MTDISALCRPQDEEAMVRCTLDGILLGRASAHQVLLNVPPEALTSGRAREIWESALRLYRAGQAPDHPNLERDLHRAELCPTEQAWLNHLTWLDRDAYGDEEALGQAVIGYYQRRQMVSLYQQSAQDSTALLLDHLEIAQSTSAQSLRIIAGGDGEPISAGDTILDLIAHNMKFRADQEGAGRLVRFGIPILDGDPGEGGISGAPGHVVIVAARPGIGKTALAVQILGATADAGEPALYCSLELDRFEALQRIAGWVTDTRRGAYWSGTYNEYHTARLRAAKPVLDRIKVWDPPRPTWSRIEAKIRGAAQRGIRVAVIDHFSEINLSGLIPKGGKKFEGASECAQRVKALAKELSICIVLLAQLNREIPRGEIPGTEHLRESGELEQIAYSILALYRDAPSASSKVPSLRGPDAPPPVLPQLRMAIIKNRDGKAGYTRRLDLDGATCRIRDTEDPA